MYDPIFAKSFTRYDQRRFCNCAVVLCMIMALSICTLFKPHLHPLSVIGNALNLKSSIDAAQDMLGTNETSSSLPLVAYATDLRLSAGAAQDMLMIKDTSTSPPVAENAADLRSSVDAAHDKSIIKDTSISPPVAENAADLQSSVDAAHDKSIIKDASISPPVVGNATNLQLSVGAVQDLSIIKDTSTWPPLATEAKEAEPICRVLEPLSDYCEIKGDIRIQGNSSTIFVVLRQVNSFVGNNSWIIQPYPRKGNTEALDNVKKWTVKLVADQEVIPKCSLNHTIPAVLFSTGGYSGNHFHDFTDLIVPIYSTSQQFNGEVEFLATDYASWWISKFRLLLSKLSRHEVIAIDKEKEIHCYPSMVAGLKRHKELDIDPSKFPNGLSMYNFRQFLRKTYSLDRTNAIKLQKGDGKKPRLMIVSRRKTRLLTNEGEITQMARKLGYDVVAAEANISSNLTRFAQLVNSCDVLMGVHGAGLTNMVFLPDNAVLIQVVPLGAIEGFARNDFGKPSNDMNIRYLEYEIKESESSLIQQYPLDHAVFRDPLSFRRQGWMEMRKIYLDNQDVKIDLRRFRPTLVKALKLLRHRYMSPNTY